MTRDRFTQAIRAKARPIWDRELKHPFVRGTICDLFRVVKVDSSFAHEFTAPAEFRQQDSAGQPIRRSEIGAESICGGF
jgi:hypothetical protein